MEALYICDACKPLLLNAIIFGAAVGTAVTVVFILCEEILFVIRAHRRKRKGVDRDDKK